MPRPEAGPLAAVRQDVARVAATDEAGRGAPAASGCATWSCGCAGSSSPRSSKLHVEGISDGSQPFVLWSNRQLASRHRSYSGDVFADFRKLADQLKDADAGLAKLFAANATDAETERRLRAGLERFCAVFPDAFVVSDRGPYFDPNAAGQGRPLTAGFHLMQGYFRDDGPLCELILDDAGRRELDALWDELNFVTLAPMRQYKDFIFFERAEPPRFMREAEFDFARSEDKDATSEAKMDRLAEAYLAKARKQGAERRGAGGDRDLFRRHLGGNSPGRAGPAGRRAEPSRGAGAVRRAGLPPAAVGRRAGRSAGVLSQAAPARTTWATRRRCATRSSACCCRPISATASISRSRARPCGRCRTTRWPAG